MRVLIADDEPSIVRLAMKHLTQNGFEVETARDGGEALAKIQANLPDVLVCDVMMPVMGGFELCSILGNDERFSDIKVVLLVGCAPQGSSRIPFEALSFVPLTNVSLVKPFNPLDLIFAVNKLAGIKQPE